VVAADQRRRLRPHVEFQVLEQIDVLARDERHEGADRAQDRCVQQHLRAAGDWNDGHGSPPAEPNRCR